jgi:hypothetical protein
VVVHQTRLAVGCSWALLLLLNSVGLSGEDPWLKYTAEAAQHRRDGLYSEAEAKYVSAYRLVVDTAESGRLGTSLIDLANLYADMGRYADAETAAQQRHAPWPFKPRTHEKISKAIRSTFLLYWRDGNDVDDLRRTSVHDEMQ